MKNHIFPLLILLLIAAACHSPVGNSDASDADFNSLFNKGKNYALNPYHTDSALMILHPLLRRQQGDEKALNRGKVLNIIGVAYDIKGMYDSAAYYLFEARRLAEETRDDTLQMSVYSNLGLLQFALKNADEAVEYYTKSLAIAEKLNHTIHIANQLNNIGNTYMTLKNDFDKAIPYFQQCKDFSAKNEYHDGYKVAGSNLVEAYSGLGELDKAEREIKQITEHYGATTYAQFTLGAIYSKKGNYREAIHTFKELLKRKLDTREFELRILKTVAETYKTSGNPDSTVVYLEKSYALRDTLHNRQTYQTIHDLKIAYETEKKVIQIAALEEEKRLMIWLGIAAGAVFLLVLTAFFFLWRFTVQKRQLAETRIRQLEQEQQLIATQSVLDGETQERTRLARDLHDGLGGKLTGVKLHLQELKRSANLDDADVQQYDKAMDMLDASVQEMRRVSHNLMPDALSRFGLKPAVDDFCRSMSPCIVFNFYGNETRLDPKLELLIYRCIHELVNNALKYSGASQIMVQIMQEADSIDFTVQDDGCGFDPRAATKGTGLQNIRTRIASFGGNIHIDTTVGEGTEINVELKIES
jgi:signal transduction histidine kinase